MLLRSLSNVQVLYQTDLKVDGHLQTYAPGLPAFLRFPQAEGSVLAQQRSLVRALWTRCYFAKDYEGAALVGLNAFNTMTIS